MKSNLTNVSLALVSAVLILGCQDLGTGVVASDGPGPAFAHKEGHTKGGGGGGTAAWLTLEGGMEVTSLEVSVGKDSDTQLKVSKHLMSEIRMNFMKTSSDCIAGEFTSQADVVELLAELNDATMKRSDIWMGIDKSGLTAEEDITTSENHALIVEREGTFADPETGHTVVRLGKLQRDDVSVKWISSNGSRDVFEFTGPVTVTARGVGGRGGRRSYRGISCGGDNLVTVTLNRSQA